MDSRYLQNNEELKRPQQEIDEDRRSFLTAGLIGGAVAAGTLAAGAAHAQQIAQAPALTDKAWWPHPKWGKDDQAGASNYMTPAKVLDTVKLIKDGKVYRIGRIYESSMPKFGERAFTDQEMNSAYGMKKLGIENVKPFFTRGHLFDVEAVKGAMMEAGQEITIADLKAALQKQNMQEADIKEGDAVFLNTGWGKLWMKNNDKFNGGEPGIGLEAAKWFIDKGIALTGADTWGTEVVPNPNKDLAFPVHAELIAKNGIFNHENLDFTGLIADGKYQFAYIFSPAPIRGATGSNGGPIAVT